MWPAGVGFLRVVANKGSYRRNLTRKSRPGRTIRKTGSSMVSMRRLFKACPMRALQSQLPRERHLRFMLKRVALLGFLAVLIVANLSVSANAGRGDHDSGFSRSRDGRFGDHGRF